MQLDFTADQSTSERMLLLRPYLKVNLLVVVVCGGCMIKHWGTLTDFNADGSVLALDNRTERERIVYSGNDFEQYKRNFDNTKERWQYIPTGLVRCVVVPDNIFL